MSEKSVTDNIPDGNPIAQIDCLFSDAASREYFSRNKSFRNIYEADSISNTLIA